MYRRSVVCTILIIILCLYVPLKKKRIAYIYFYFKAYAQIFSLLYLYKLYIPTHNIDYDLFYNLNIKLLVYNNYNYF